MVTTARVPGVRTLATMVDRHYLTRHEWILALTGPRRQPSGASVHAGDCLGLLLALTLIVV
jgi:hypothetical protein